MYAISPKGSLIVATADIIPGIPTRRVPPGQRYRVTWQTPAPAAHPERSAYPVKRAGPFRLCAARDYPWRAARLRWPTLVRPTPRDCATSPTAAVYAPAH